MNELHPPRTVKDLEIVTGLEEQAVKRAIIAGQLPGSKVGGRYVIPGDAFDAYCEGRWTAREWRAPDPIRPIPEMIPPAKGIVMYPDYEEQVEESLANWNGYYDSMGNFDDVPFDEPTYISDELYEGWWPVTERVA